MIIHVNVKPNSNKDELEKTGDNEYSAWVKAEPEKGKANSKLINLIAHAFGVDFRRIKIKNPASRKKVIEIDLI